MAKRKTSTETEGKTEVSENVEGVVDLRELCGKLDGLANLVNQQADRIKKLELKIDAVEKRNAQIRFSGDDIFRKGSDPFEKRLR